MIGVIVIDTLEQLLPHRSAWEELRARTPGADVVPAWEGFVALQRPPGVEQRMRVLLVVMQGTVVGIWPLVRRCVETRCGTVRCLTSPFGPYGFWQGPIGPHLAATLHTTLHHLRHGVRDWDVVQFSNLPTEGWLITRLFTALQAQGFHPQRDCGDDIGVIDLSDGWDEYWKSRPECLRAACRNQEDRWGVASGVRHVTHRFGACEPLHSPKLQRLLKRIAGLDHVGRDRVGTLCSDMPSERLDHALLASLPQVVGDAVTVEMELEVHGLEVAGQLQAAALNIRVADLWHNVGVVAADRATLPVFMRSMLEHRARRGDGSLRMCLSSGCGLEAWYTQSLKSHRIQCYHWSARSQLLNWNRKLHSWFHGRRRGGAQAGDGGGDRRPQLGAAGPGSGPSSVALDRRVERLPPRLQPHLRIYRGREFVED